MELQHGGYRTISIRTSQKIEKNVQSNEIKFERTYLKNILRGMKNVLWRKKRGRQRGGRPSTAH
jgi:cell division protein FtsI/penicillin-binding protein 2